MSFGSTPFGTGAFGTASLALVEISNISPADFTTIAPLDSISFKLTASGLLRRVLIVLAYPATDGAPELAYDGSTFQPGYGDSTATASGALVTSFVLRHSHGGWPSRPNLIVFAFDQTGQEL